MRQGSGIWQGHSSFSTSTTQLYGLLPVEKQFGWSRIFAESKSSRTVRYDSHHVVIGEIYGIRQRKDHLQRHQGQNSWKGKFICKRVLLNTCANVFTHIAIRSITCASLHHCPSSLQCPTAHLCTQCPYHSKHKNVQKAHVHLIARMHFISHIHFFFFTAVWRCVQVIQYFYYKTKYAKATPPIPKFDIEPNIALELLIAANYLDVWAVCACNNKPLWCG